MRIVYQASLVAVALVAAAVFARPAQAQGCGGNGWGGGWPYNFQSGIYGRTNAYNLPYFSLHPPVYYSHVVPRPYGYSPFAVPPGMEPAEMRVPAPKEIVNPHVKPKPDDKAPADKAPAAKTSAHTARLEIVNPYYHGFVAQD